MDYIEINKLTENTERLLGYIGKDGEKVVIKNISKNIDLQMFNKPVIKRWSETDGDDILDFSKQLKPEHKEWLKYLGENLDTDFFASNIKTADKLP